MPNAHSTDARIPSAWLDAARQIIREGVRHVLVLGAVDVGKSTFCRELLRAANGAGKAARLIDSDVGQKMVGPPACVTLGQTTSDAELSLLELVFVGTTSPVRAWRQLIAGTARLVEHAGKAIVVINTGGLLSGPGRRLKSQKLSALKPDLVIGIGEDSELNAVLNEASNLPVTRLPASPLARRKTEGERRAARREAFRAYFTPAVEVAIAIRDLEMIGAPAPQADPPIRLLVGLATEAGRDLGLGIVISVDTATATLICLTPVDPAEIALLRWGSITLDERFSDSPAAA
jgi:polynucleotide 5'-hydroxyl-kinase GRC3/NOL9